MYDLVQSSPFVGIMPRPVPKDGDTDEDRAKSVEDKVKKMEELYTSLVLTQIEKAGTPEVWSIYGQREGDRLWTERKRTM